MSAPWIAIIVTLALFVVGHLITTVWWASKVSTLLDRVQTDLRDIVTELKAVRNVYVTKDDYLQRMISTDKEHTAIWGAIDALRRNGGGT